MRDAAANRNGVNDGITMSAERRPPRAAVRLAHRGAASRSTPSTPAATFNEMTGRTSSATTNAGPASPRPKSSSPEDRVDDQGDVGRQIDQVEEEVLRVPISDPSRSPTGTPTTTAPANPIMVLRRVSQKLMNTVPGAGPHAMDRPPRSPTCDRRPRRAATGRKPCVGSRKATSHEERRSREHRAASTRRPSAVYYRRLPLSTRRGATPSGEESAAPITRYSSPGGESQRVSLLVSLPKAERNGRSLRPMSDRCRRGVG